MCDVFYRGSEMCDKVWQEVKIGQIRTLWAAPTRLLEESNFSRKAVTGRPHQVNKAITSERLAQGTYVSARA